ncbi:efflux RND transporter periplasmic adaptor subunit [Synechococcus sp. Nb3U1]|uniref:efflux RND transporter periplasmic adaptor subunit n=1 Tax=Synechococcus sp. Nb3U1 TaxID=1914529 RepID=UPI001F3AA24F|nr:efflux RND transporter periplasmic adaptor subunit [Synechococcus sp. Nb3U1]MCF2970541.1 efflux RND transporter periplasmic adaptor subunit [Synechococcus sp. Nb3U1]
MKQHVLWSMVVAGILGSATLAGLVLGQQGATQSTSAEGSEAAAETPLPPRIGALGRIEPEGEVLRIAGPAGERVGELLVAEGDKVVAGQVVARLESYAERAAEREYAAAQLQEARARLEAETRFSQAQIQEARTRVSQLDQPQLMQIRSQEAVVERIQAELADAEANLARFQALWQEGAVSRQELDQRSLVVRQRQEELRSAQATLTQLQTARTQDLLNAQAQVQAAEAGLTLAQAQVQLGSLARNLELAEARLERTLIRSPRDGRVLQIRTYPGEAIANNDGILDLGNTDQMMVVAEIYETDILRIQLGQQATISNRALPEELRGQVERIGLQIRKKDVLNTDPAADVDARVVEVRIRLDPQSSERVAGLTNLQVDVAIDVEG